VAEPEQVKRTLLVVEDNAIAREGLVAVLRHAGYEVVAAEHGQEALDLLRGGVVVLDLILLDMLMPVLDGWHFLEELKRQGPASGVPILVTTGSILTREWAVDHGCRGIVHKPIDTEELLAEVERCVG
jgi:CheY-like chemotaxis protein